MEFGFSPTIVLFVSILVVIPLVLKKRERAKFERLLKPQLSSRGGRIRRTIVSRPEYEFEYKGAQCQVSLHTTSPKGKERAAQFLAFLPAKQVSSLEIQANFGGSLQDFTLGMLPKNYQQFTTADSTFDQSYIVCGDKKDFAERFLSQKIREELIALKDYAPSISLAEANTMMASMVLKKIKLPDTNLAFLSLSIPGEPEQEEHYNVLIESGILFLEQLKNTCC